MKANLAIKVLHTLAMASCVTVGALPTSSEAAVAILPSIADSIVLDGSASVNPFPGILASELGTTGAGSVWLSVLKFDLSSLVSSTVNSATLELTSTFNHSNAGFSHQVFSSNDDSWTEATVNGLNRPANSTLSLLSATSINGVSQAYTWNVLSGVVATDGLAGTGNVLTLMIRPDLVQSGNVFGPHFNDRGIASGFPRLILDISPVPEPTSWLLLAVGIAGITYRLRERGRKFEYIR